MVGRALQRGNSRSGRGLAVALALAAAAPAPPAFTPALDADFPDPFVLPAGGRLYAYATNTVRDGRAINVQVAQSADGRRWSAPVEAMPEPPPWARAGDADIWAPAALRVGGRYVLYFSARHASLRRPDGLTLCVGAATADRPEGPFVAQREPLSCGGAHGVIDASPLRDGQGRLWLHMKLDGNCCGAATVVVAQRLEPNGLRLTGEPVALAGVAADAAWKGAVIEAPEVIRRRGRYTLFYAANDYGGAAYAVGAARCDGPLGPCADDAGNPMLRTGRGVIGPGHQSVFRWRGRSWIAFHGWRPGPPRYRAMYIAPLRWRRGAPSVP